MAIVDRDYCDRCREMAGQSHESWCYYALEAGRADGYTLAKSVLEYESLYGDVLPDIQAWRDVLSQAKKIVEGVEG